MLKWPFREKQQQMINLESWGFLVVFVNQYTKGSRITENGSSLRAGAMETFFEDVNENTFDIEISLRLKSLS